MSIEQEFRLAYGEGHSAGIERDRTLFMAGWHAAIRWERSSLHTCSDVCDRPMCVKNRRIATLEKQRLTIAAWGVFHEDGSAHIYQQRTTAETFGIPEPLYRMEE